MRSIYVVLVAAALMAPPLSLPAAARSMMVVRDAHIRLPPPGAPTAAGYATVTNASRTSDRLMGAESPGWAKVEIHQMSMAGGVMRMREVTEGLPIGPGQTLRLAEGGYHFMFIGPKRPPKVGDETPVTLRFQSGGRAPATFTVGR